MTKATFGLMEKARDELAKRCHRMLKIENGQLS